MEMFSYPATVTKIASGDYLVRFADIPEAITGGDTPAKALENAPDALAGAIDGYLEMDLPVPTPRKVADGEHLVALDPEVAARVALRRRMSELGLTKVALAQRMNRDEKAVRRILSGKNASFSMTMDALKAVGLRPALSV